MSDRTPPADRQPDDRSLNVAGDDDEARNQLPMIYSVLGLAVERPVSLHTSGASPVCSSGSGDPGAFLPHQGGAGLTGRPSKDLTEVR